MSLGHLIARRTRANPKRGYDSQPYPYILTENDKKRYNQKETKTLFRMTKNTGSIGKNYQNLRMISTNTDQSRRHNFRFNMSCENRLLVHGQNYQSYIKVYIIKLTIFNVLDSSITEKFTVSMLQNFMSQSIHTNYFYDTDYDIDKGRPFVDTNILVVVPYTDTLIEPSSRDPEGKSRVT